MASALSAPHFNNEDAAFAYVEARFWPSGAICPHCGETARVSRMGGKATRKGLHKCYSCRKQFTVRQGTIFESSHLPLNVWLQAIFLLAASKKGISSHQLHRMLGITLKTAWFLSHRIREAMRSGDLDKFGADGGAVEVDETFIGTLENATKALGGSAHKMKVFSLIERNSGRARSVKIDAVTLAQIEPIIAANVAREAHLMSDEHLVYRRLKIQFAKQSRVFHTVGEYARGTIHTNTIEGFFSIFKRGMRGIYQHCRERHLHRYLAEFDFRYSNRMALGCDDLERADRMLQGFVGKRLTYQQSCARA
jgi:transposase-like protein